MPAAPVLVGIIRHAVVLSRRGGRVTDPSVSYLTKSIRGTGEVVPGWQSPFDAHRTGAMRALRCEPLFPHTITESDYANAKVI